MADLTTKQNTYSAKEPQRDYFLITFRGLLEIIRDFGMLTVAFGTGIYAFILLLQGPMAPEYKALVALALTLSAMLASLWSYARVHPRVQSEEVKDQLKRMTDLVERLIEKSLNSRSG